MKLTNWFPRVRFRQPDHLLIACFPKSGSTYLSRIFREITGLPEAFVAQRGAENQQDICRTACRRLRHRSVIQQHVKATRTNLDVMLKHGIRPIVQTRNLYDVLVSLHDYLARLPHSLPCGFVSRDYGRMDRRDQLDYLIQLHLPWYFNFVLAWRHAALQIEVCQITYEELFADQARSLARTLNFYRLEASADRVAAAIARTGAASRG